ncbi:MAG: hypothetical protein GX303_04350 [Clostridiales bacterium]|nr:hypothetical protein [Clostridiales bacterium]
MTGNPYPPRPGYYEGTQMWKLANYLKAELERYGFEVVTTRPNLTDDPTLEARGQMAGQNGSALFVSLHSNAPASATDTVTTGTVVFYSMADEANKPLADKLGQKVSGIMGHHYRGSMTREYPGRPGVDYYGVIRSAAESGCKAAYIIEHGFHTNPADSAFLIAGENLKKLAVAEAQIIADHFGYAKEVNIVGKTYTIKEFTITIGDDGTIQIGGSVQADAVPVQPIPVEPTAVEPEDSFKPGDKVRVRQDAYVYGTSNKFAPVVYGSVYEILQQPKGDRVVFGTGEVVIGAVHLDDIIHAE